MHERNIYRAGVNFAQLGRDCPSFVKYLVKGPSQIDFNDPDAVRELTTSLLKRDFGLDVELPEDRLCPPVPNRLNYILWLQDLLDHTSGGKTDDYDPEREVVGLDIGVGASCIYPLLGCATRPKWKFVGTDIDEKSLACARAQVERNNLNERICVVESTPDGPFFDFDRLGVSQLDFTMCNPPFYSSPSSLLSLSTTSNPQSTTRKRLPPYSPTCRGTPTEMCTPGGEVAFATRQIHESAHPSIRTKVRWFSIMLGVKSSIPPLVELLKEVSVTNWAVTTFVQISGGSRGAGGRAEGGAGGGGKKQTQRTGTRRWGLAWSFIGYRPGWGKHVYGISHPPHLSSSTSSPRTTTQGIKPFKGVFEIVVPFSRFSPLTASQLNQGQEQNQEQNQEQEEQQITHLLEKILDILTSLKKTSSPSFTEDKPDQTNHTSKPTITWDITWQRPPPSSLFSFSEKKPAIINAWIQGDIWSRKARRRRGRELGSSHGGGTGGTGGDRENKKVEDGEEGRQDQNPYTDEQNILGMFFRITIDVYAEHSSYLDNFDNENYNDDQEQEQEQEEDIVLHEHHDDYTPNLTPPPPPTITTNHPPTAETETKTTTPKSLKITLRLIRTSPNNFILFESFCGMVRRKVLVG